MATLYLDGRILSSNNGNTEHCNSTQVISLVAAFLPKLPIHACVVLPEDAETLSYNEYDKQVDSGFKIPSDRFESLKVVRSVPPEVSASRLPVVTKSCGTYLICGLCHVLRYLVKKGGESDPAVLKLLGYKQSCFKCTAEVGSRVYLCEVAAASYIDGESMQSHFKPAGYIPPVISEFEALLKSPIAIHNMDKQQRKILGKVKAHEQHKERIPKERISKKRKEQEPVGGKRMKAEKEVVDTKDLPCLSHVFADGVDFMLSDLSLLPSTHSYLLRYFTQTEVRDETPLVTKWYNRVQQVPGVVEAVRRCHVDFFPIRPAGREFSVQQTEGDFTLLEYQKGKREAKHKPLKPLTVKRDLQSVLDKIGTDVEFNSFDEDDLKIDWPNLPEDVHPTKGELTSLRAKRKCHQIENLVKGVMSLSPTEGKKIVEFCCGGGHVGIVLAYLLPACRVVLLDNKEESLSRAHARVEALGLKNVTIYQCNLDMYDARFDVGVSLHACGVATDMVLRKCLTHHASFVSSPCCYGKMQKTDDITYPHSEETRSKSVSYDEWLVVGMAADRTDWKFETDKAKQGKMCMGLVDLDRCRAANEKGYTASLYTMLPRDCSPKNNMIIGLAPCTTTTR